MIATLHVITRLTLGGSSENTVLTMEALRRAGYDGPLVIGAESERSVVEDARQRGCHIVEVPWLVRAVRPQHDVAAVLALVRLFQRERPTVVHTHSSKAGFVGRLAARLSGVPIVIHQPHGHIFYGYWGAARTRLFIALERLAARWTDTLIALTPREVEEHVERGIGRPAQWAVVPSGVPTAALRASAPSRRVARARLGLSADAFVVMGVGRLVPIKGFDILLAALPALLARVPAAQVVLLGEGERRPELEAQARALGVADRVRMVGAVKDVTAHLAAADVLAAPSRNEGMGRVLVEAMAVGLPVVGAAVGGIPDVIDDGECGRLVPADDPAALAEALADLGRDAALRAKLGSAARTRAEAFSTDVAAAAIGAIYDAHARARRPGR